tara:strand:- start:5101 stop:6576 length:1476 start_codon:yes stop_codon:yes gene_type:complete
MIKLSNLISEDINFKINIENLFIKGISSDSRKLEKGFLFASLTENSDLYIKNAIKKGAVALLLNKKDYKKYLGIKDIGIIAVKNPREFYGILCSNFYNLKFNHIVAVTGTNGKTSVVWMVNSFWNKIGIKSAFIGTLGVFDNNKIYKTDLTTPSIDQIYLNLMELQKKNFKNVIIEASSHGIHQNRIGGLNISIAVITSLSRDHLDYHKNFTNYKKAKLRLFETIPSNGLAIINDSIKEYKEFIKASKNNNLKIVTVGENKTSDWYYKIKHYKDNRQEIEVINKNKKRNFFTNIIGKFQINNLITSMAILNETGVSFKTLIENIDKVSVPPGRLEYIGKTKESTEIFIDYAHTPDALKNVLLSVRPYVKKNLCIVFGCGGDRDKGKRSIMGKIAYKHADIIYVTDDNPRNEDAKKIRRHIIANCPNAIEVANRKNAITKAIHHCKKGDILLILGKGHEETQEINNNFKHFSDKEEVYKIIGSDNSRNIREL